MPEVQDRRPRSVIRLRQSGRPDSLQGLGVHDSELWLQYQDSQRGCIHQRAYPVFAANGLLGPRGPVTALGLDPVPSAESGDLFGNGRAPPRMTEGFSWGTPPNPRPGGALGRAEQDTRLSYLEASMYSRRDALT